MNDISTEQIAELSYIRSGTAKHQKGAQAAARVLQEATKIFCEKGYSGTSLRSVAKAAKMDIYNVQYYFRNKENLLAAIIECHLLAFNAFIDRETNDTKKTPKKRFETIIREQFGHHHSPELRKLYTQHLAIAENNEFAAELLDVMFTRYRNALAGLIKEFNPSLTKRECLRRSSLISVFLEGFNIYSGHWIPAHSEHKGLEKEAYNHLLRIANA